MNSQRQWYQLTFANGARDIPYPDQSLGLNTWNSRWDDIGKANEREDNNVSKIFLQVQWFSQMYLLTITIFFDWKSEDSWSENARFLIFYNI